MENDMKKIGFVIPWYYEDIRGGAEQEMRGLVKHLHEAGVDVEIITTCVKILLQTGLRIILKKALIQLTVLL